ncbi:hypothetical protein EB169_04625 [archaeon]|nr:hypothetical protein [archaeon]
MEMKNIDILESSGYLYCPNFLSSDINDVPPKNDDGSFKLGNILYKSQRGISRCHYDNEKFWFPNSTIVINENLYKSLSIKVCDAVQSILGLDLLPTFHYSAFYYKDCFFDQSFMSHNREITVSIQIKSIPNVNWRYGLSLTDYCDILFTMQDGDALIYKGDCVFPMRPALELDDKNKDKYHHQLYFHYVNSQGNNVHYAYKF